VPDTRTFCTDAELAALKPDTEGATLYIDPPAATSTMVTLGKLVQRAMEAVATAPCSVQIQLREKCWLNGDQIRQLSSRFTS
jgi:hypothetical protein